MQSNQPESVKNSTVVHGIVQGHDGVVIVNSQPGQGASFTIYLPSPQRPSTQRPNTQRPVTQPPDECIGHSNSEKVASNDLQPKPEDKKAHHILYLDDDEAVLEVVKQLLERGGFRTSCFSDYRAALFALSNHSADFDLVVTDYNMPGMHGLEVAREIRKTHEFLPIVITSGYVDAELTAGAATCGVQQLIAKPFRLAELYAVVQRLVKK